MNINFVEKEVKGSMTACEAFFDEVKVGEIWFEKDFDPAGGELLLSDPERKFRIERIERTPEGTTCLEHSVLCEEFYRYMRDRGYEMAVRIYYNGEAEGKETDGLSLYDYYDLYWDRYEVYARKL